MVIIEEAQIQKAVSCTQRECHPLNKEADAVDLAHWSTCEQNQSEPKMGNNVLCYHSDMLLR